MLSTDKRKYPTVEDGRDEENELETYSENRDTIASSVPTTKKRKRDLARSVIEGLSGSDPFEGIICIHVHCH